MGGTAPTDAELLDDADTETAAAAAERSAQQLHLWAFHVRSSVAISKHFRKLLHGIEKSKEYQGESIVSRSMHVSQL